MCKLSDVKYIGRQYTWTNKQEGESRVFSEIDRTLANEAWLSCYASAEVSYLPEGEYDHCTNLLCVYPEVGGGKKPFKFFNMWVQAPKILRNS